MESIILQVPESTARKWQQASEDTKERAVEAVREILDSLDTTVDGGEDKEKLLQRARDAFSRFNTDLSDFTFNREEANER